MQQAWELVGGMSDSSKRRATDGDLGYNHVRAIPIHQASTAAASQAPLVPCVGDSQANHQKILAGLTDEELVRLCGDDMPRSLGSFRRWAATILDFGKGKRLGYSYGDCVALDADYVQRVASHMGSSTGSQQKDFYNFCARVQKIQKALKQASGSADESEFVRRYKAD